MVSPLQTDPLPEDRIRFPRNFMSGSCSQGLAEPAPIQVVLIEKGDLHRVLASRGPDSRVVSREVAAAFPDFVRWSAPATVNPHPRRAGHPQHVSPLVAQRSLAPTPSAVRYLTATFFANTSTGSSAACPCQSCQRVVMRTSTL